MSSRFLLSAGAFRWTGTCPRRRNACMLQFCASQRLGAWKRMEGLCAFHTLYSGGNLDFTDFTLAAKTENNRKEDLSRVGAAAFQADVPAPL